MKRLTTILFCAGMAIAMTSCGKPDTEPDTDSGASAETLRSGKIGNGSITINGETANNVFGVDFDNDGVLEFRIGGDGTDYVYLSYDYASGNNIVNKADQWDYIEPLGREVTIDGTSRFEGQGDAMFDDMATLPNLFFIGCRIVKADGTHYGWIKAHYVNGRVEWGECVYRSTPGVAITTVKE